MMPEEIIAVLEREAEKYQHFAEDCQRNRKDDGLALYWLGRRRGIMDSVKYIKRLEEKE